MASRGPYIRATKSPYQYPYQQYPYQNVGTQMTWRDSPPAQARPASVSLGNYYQGSWVTRPTAGAPEIVRDRTGYAGTDCSCHDKTGVSGVVESISNLSTPVKVAGVVGLFLLYKTMKKSR